VTFSLLSSAFLALAWQRGQAPVKDGETKENNVSTSREKYLNDPQICILVLHGIPVFFIILLMQLQEFQLERLLLAPMMAIRHSNQVLPTLLAPLLHTVCV